MPIINGLMQAVVQHLKEQIIKEPLQHYGNNKDLKSFTGIIMIILFLMLVDHYQQVHNQNNGIIIYMLISLMAMNAIIHIFMI